MLQLSYFLNAQFIIINCQDFAGFGKTMEMTLK